MTFILQNGTEFKHSAYPDLPEHLHDALSRFSTDAPGESYNLLRVVVGFPVKRYPNLAELHGDPHPLATLSTRKMVELGNTYKTDMLQAIYKEAVEEYASKGAKRMSED